MMKKIYGIFWSLMIMISLRAGDQELKTFHSSYGTTPKRGADRELKTSTSLSVPLLHESAKKTCSEIVCMPCVRVSSIVVLALTGLSFITYSAMQALNPDSYTGPMMHDILVNRCGKCPQAVFLDLCERPFNITQTMEEDQVRVACPNAESIESIYYPATQYPSCKKLADKIFPIKEKCKNNSSSNSVLTPQQKIKIKRRSMADVRAGKFYR
jgi:hypothetical protein